MKIKNKISKFALGRESLVTKAKLPSKIKLSATQLSVFLITLSLLALTGCQGVSNSARDLRSTIDQTVSNTQQKAEEIKATVQSGVNQVQTTVDSTKTAIDTKMQQINDAEQKIEAAQKAINDANQAVSTVTGTSTTTK